MSTGTGSKETWARGEGPVPRMTLGTWSTVCTLQRQQPGVGSGRLGRGELELKAQGRGIGHYVNVLLVLTGTRKPFTCAHNNHMLIIITVILCWLVLSPPIGRTQSCCPTNVVHGVMFREDKSDQTTGSELVHPRCVKSLTSSLTMGAEPSLIHLNTIYSFIDHFIYSTTLLCRTHETWITLALQSEERNS